MEFRTQPPGVGGAGEARPAVLRPASDPLQPDPRSSRNAAVAAARGASVAAYAEPIIPVRWTTTVLGWLLCAAAIVAAVVAVNTAADNMFGTLVTVGGHPWVVVTLAACAAGLLIVTAFASRGLHAFTAKWHRAFVTGCVGAGLASAAVIVAVALVVLIAAAVIFVIVCLFGAMLDL